MGRETHLSEIDAAQAIRIARMAQALFGARRSNHVLPEFATDDEPRSLPEAFAVQSEMTRLVGQPIAGWKVGYVRDVRLTHAPVYRDACVASGARVHLTASAAPAIEGEVAFVLGRDLPPRDARYTPDEVADAVSSACAAIEIGAPRLGNFMTAPLEHKIADNMGNCALVHGSGTRHWRDIDLERLRVTLAIDGVIVTDVIGGNAAGNPFDALVALANAPFRREPLRAGDVVITGTCTGIYPARAGIDAHVVFEGLGEVSVTLD
jgi:2-keto-4-pentenoate hydratase